MIREVPLLSGFQRGSTHLRRNVTGPMKYMTARWAIMKGPGCIRTGPSGILWVAVEPCRPHL